MKYIKLYQVFLNYIRSVFLIVITIISSIKKFKNKLIGQNQGIL